MHDLTPEQIIRLEDGRLYPITRDGGEDVFKSSWVHFSR